MKKIYQNFFFLIVLITASQSVIAQVTVAATAGTLTGTYTTLKTAFDAINNGTHQGVINIRIHQNTTETQVARLDSSGNATSSNYTSILIRPADTATVNKTVSLGLSGSLTVDLNGADNITIDGRPLGTGIARLLTLQHSNPNLSGSSGVLRLLNGVSTFVARFINAEALTTTAGFACSNISVSTSAATTGNYHITFDNCNISGGVVGLNIAGTAANFMDSVFITNNLVTNAQATSIIVTGVKNIIIESNTIAHTVTISGWNVNGMALNTNISGAKFLVNRNRIVNIGSLSAAQVHGVLVTPSLAAPAVIPQVSMINNYIALLANNTSATQVRGIYFQGTTNPASLTVLHNTIRVGGSGTATSGIPATVGMLKLNTATSSTFTFINNLCINTRTGSANQHVGYLNAQPASGTNNSDYNTIWGGPTDKAGWGASFYSDETAFRAAAAPNEQNSLFGNVTFAGDDNPDVAAGNDPFLQGNPLGSVPTDIYGTARSLVYPYRGAYEGGPLVVLPIHLLSFSADVKKEDVLLQWKTSFEINNKGFEIQRSVDGAFFTTISFVPSAGQGGSTSTYDFTDPTAFKSAASSIIYYRLKQVDLNGTFTYSPVEIVSQERVKTASVYAYPNPVATSLNLNILSRSAGTVTFSIIDLSGKTLVNNSRAVAAGVNNIRLNDAANLQRGVYFIKVIAEEETTVIKFIKN